MSNEIEIGEYIRTTYGRIGKVIDNDYFIPIYVVCEQTMVVDRNNIVKHSKNIIDLIEEGDHVNGMLVRKGKTANGEEKLLVGNHIIHGMALKAVNIKTIVTKEQFSSMEYKVGV